MFTDILKLSFKTITANKVRSGLSMLGIIIGVLTVLLVIALAKGTEKSIEEQYKNLSITTVMVMPITTETSTSKLSFSDAELLNQSQNITDTAALLQGKLPVASTKNETQPTILGVNTDFFRISNLALITGSFWEESDEKSKTKKVLLGKNVREDLFASDENIIGETVTIAKKKFAIAGILEPSGTTVGPITYDDSIFLPYQTAEKNVLGGDGTIRLIFLAKDIDSIGIAMQDATTLLRKEHRLRSSDSDDFRLRDQGSRITSAQESAETTSMLLSSVAVIVLIVSGIGIMNVMFAGVAERTKEIGVLKSIGAKSSDILLQFLLESIILTVIAGIFGIILGEIIIPLANGIQGMMLVRNTLGDIIAFLFAILVGIFFGMYPAYKASLLDPVDALRS